ncbi:phosphatidylinositol phosphate synthase [Corynebacterium endometrii]|uniref:Phosphatidylinositol phosphate synthase n=1 Tax=Corynebacterium endometrii TaxID=2488819 RepID=A0A4P7QFP4_9CORY|nr:CDP-alcohol phosphatidyltransferase family protein [Corynebacterium endometrii]QCB28561.1 CDP-diacylglycerol--inositol 3-phosphatidyltransferase [Corynebacterium endometrii]
MLSVHGRKPAAVVVEPIAKAAMKLGLTPNKVTIIGTVVTIAVAVTLIPTGHLFLAAVLSGLFAAFDMVDGTMARMRGGGTAFGATLDASCDRITDGALFAAILWYLIYTMDSHPVTVVAALVTLVSSQVISYIKARGEASGLRMVGGLIERPERLIISLVGVGLEGLGVPHALAVSLWILAIGSLFTVAQRLHMAANQKVK